MLSLRGDINGDTYEGFKPAERASITMSLLAGDGPDIEFLNTTCGYVIPGPHVYDAAQPFTLILDEAQGRIAVTEQQGVAPSPLPPPSFTIRCQGG